MIRHLQERIVELEEENERLKADVRNCQQVIWLRRDLHKKMNAKILKLERDNNHIEQAFENFVNEVETDKLSAKIKEDMEIAQLRARIKSAA